MNKTLETLSLFSKYVGLKRAWQTIDLNSNLFSEEEAEIYQGLGAEVADLNIDLKIFAKGLERIVEQHKLLFLKKGGDLLSPDKLPSDTFREVFLSAVYMSGGHIEGCLNFLNDLVAATYSEITASDQVTYAISYTKELIKGDYLVPQVVTISASGEEVEREDLDELDTAVQVDKLRLTLTEKGYLEVQNTVDEVEARREKLLASIAREVSFVTMESPSRMLN